MKFSFVNLFFSCFEVKKFHYIVIKINENHIYRFINNTGKIKLRDIHSKDGITEITFNYKDKNKVLDIAEKMGIKIYIQLSLIWKCVVIYVFLVFIEF